MKKKIITQHVAVMVFVTSGTEGYLNSCVLLQLFAQDV
jgi:hypothetical protein